MCLAGMIGVMSGLATLIECRFSTLWGRWMGFFIQPEAESARLGLTEPEGFGETRVERTPPKLNEYFESGSTLWSNRIRTIHSKILTVRYRSAPNRRLVVLNKQGPNAVKCCKRLIYRTRRCTHLVNLPQLYTSYTSTSSTSNGPQIPLKGRSQPHLAGRPPAISYTSANFSNASAASPCSPLTSSFIFAVYFNFE
jgi:hypothetical protein